MWLSRGIVLPDFSLSGGTFSRCSFIRRNQIFGLTILKKTSDLMLSVIPQNYIKLENYIVRLSVKSDESSMKWSQITICVRWKTRQTNHILIHNEPSSSVTIPLYYTFKLAFPPSMLITLWLNMIFIQHVCLSESRRVIS